MRTAWMARVLPGDVFMSSGKVTTNHDEIRQWVEARDGSPARVKSTSNKGDMGILRIDFPGYSGEDSLEHVEWDDWFQAFEQSGLAFLHQDKTEGGEVSRFNKLISRESQH